MQLEKWEQDNMEANQAALRKIRCHMPVNIRKLSEHALSTTPSPNGKYLPKSMAKKFKRTNILMILRLDPQDIERMHPSTLENMRITGLTLTERRALHAHLWPVGCQWNDNKSEKMTERKCNWYTMMKDKFQETLELYEKHIQQYGPPENHPNAARAGAAAPGATVPGCPLIGSRCPVKADKAMDYSGDYGWTEEGEYETPPKASASPGDTNAKAVNRAVALVKEKRANERATELKKHYKGVLAVSKANGSCEQMDEAMDMMELELVDWIKTSMTKEQAFSDDDKKKLISSFTRALNGLKLDVLDSAARSGMQTFGKRKKGPTPPDTRSAIECGLAEELVECSEIFFGYIADRMEELKLADQRISKTIELLQSLLGELHERNQYTLERLGMDRPERSRKRKTTQDIKEAIRNSPSHTASTNQTDCQASKDATAPKMEASTLASGETPKDPANPKVEALTRAMELAEQRAIERAPELRKHCKGVLAVSKANGSCEQMDEAMDSMELALVGWIKNSVMNQDMSDEGKKKMVASFSQALNSLKLAVLECASRSGMQISGRKKAGPPPHDPRSAVECGLAEEVVECSGVFLGYIKDRMAELKSVDHRVNKMIQSLESILDKLHERNITTLGVLGADLPKRSRKLKTTQDIKEVIQDSLKLKAAQEELENEEGKNDAIESGWVLLEA